MKPVWIKGAFGWFHAGGRARGAVLCPPVGPENDYTHRLLGELADRLAEAGVSVLRLDYRGTRNSLPCDDPSRPVAAWVESAAAASRWLRAEAGVKDVALVGLRFGAAVAVACAEAQGGIDRLVLLAPVGSGQAYRRELAMLARVSREEMRLPAHVAKDDVGMGLSPETLADMSNLELCVGPVRPARRALALMRPGAATDRKLIERMQAAGCEIEEAPFEGYATLMTRPEDAVYPQAAFGQVVEWLSEGLQASAGAGPRHLPVEAAYPGFKETAVSFREEAPLHGIYCTPEAPRSDLPALLFLNTGAINHAGMEAMWPGQARRLARAGLTSLRFDLSGFGDSPARLGQLDSFENMAEALVDVDAAIRWLMARGHDRITLVGFCWGAQLACNVAQTDPRVTGLVMVNPRRLFWELETPPLDEVIGLKGYLRMAREPARWRAVLKGQVSLRRIFGAPAQIVRRAAAAGQARSQGRDTPAQAAARKLRAISARGVDTFVVQGHDDPFLAEFEDYFDTPRAALPQLFGMKMYYPDGVDHLFRNERVRDELGEVIAAHLTAHAFPARAHEAA